MKRLLQQITTRRVSLWIFLLSVLLLSSCYTPDEPDTGTQRVVIVYLAGDDNGLSGEVQQKIDALTRGFLSMGGNEAYKLLIYADSGNSAPRLFEVSASHGSTGGVGWQQHYPPQNSASAEVLQRVLADAIKAFKAHSYGLILFSHGTAWLPAADTRTVATDQKHELELTDFAAALPLPQGKKFRFILFENCYMGSVEVAYELQDKTEAILASPAEVVSPGMTEVYPSALPLLYHPAPDLEGFARAYFEVWNAKQGDYRSATISTIRTAELKEIAALARSAFEQGSIPAAPQTASLQSFNRSGRKLFFDLEELLATVNPPLQPLVKQALNQAVSYCAATPFFLKDQPYGFSIRHYSGLSVYLMQKEYEALNTCYRQLRWYKEVLGKPE